MKRPCLDCGEPTTRTTRCTACQRRQWRRQNAARGPAAQQGYDADYRRRRKAMIAEWVEDHGWVCPGYQVPAHPVPVGKLTADHVIPLAEGGRDGPLRPLCKSCNGRKGQTTSNARRQRQQVEWTLRIREPRTR